MSKFGKGSRAAGTSQRARGINPRALGTNPRRNRRISRLVVREGFETAPAAGGLPRWLRFEILKRDRFRCSYCGAAAKDGAVLQVDHIHPRALGGKDLPANLTTSCGDCNAGKAARMLTESIL